MRVDVDEDRPVILRPGLQSRTRVFSQSSVVVDVLPDTSTLTVEYYVEADLLKAMRSVCGQRLAAGIRKVLLLHDDGFANKAKVTVTVPSSSPSRSGDTTVYVLDINQPSLHTLCILFLCLFLSLWPFQLYFIPIILPTTLRFLTLFFESCSCLIGPCNYIFLFMKVSLSPDIICG